MFIARIACGVFAGSLALGAATLPASVAAQSAPPYARPESVPANGIETIHGVIESIEGPYRISVRDDRGFIDDVTLRQGTIINPRGLRLRPGMIVTISGYVSASTLTADQIDSPSQYDAGPPGGSYYGSYPDYYDYGQYYGGVPVETTTIIVQPGNPSQSPPPVRRGIEPPRFGRPVRHPLDGKVESPPPQPPLPPYAVPVNVYRARSIPAGGPSNTGRVWSSSDRGSSSPNRGSSSPDRGSSTPERSQPSAPQNRAPAPEYHAPPAPPPPAPRSEPPPRAEPPRENKEPAKPH